MSLKQLLFVLATLTIVISTGDSIFYRGSESYMSDVNLERFYLMEENVMSNADVLMRADYFGPEEEESEEEHKKHALNITEMESILAKAKDLHKDVGPDLGNFLGHPINMYHLFRRLNDEWSKGLNLLLQSTPCKLWKIRSMRRYLGFLKDNVPSDEDYRRVVRHMLRLQKIYGTPMSEMTNGWLGNIQAGEPLDIDDQYHIATILYENEDIPEALTWFELVQDWLKSASDLDLKKVAFNQIDLFSKMSSGYYTVGRIDDAVEVTKKLLSLDKTNTRVLETLNFFFDKQMAQQVQGPPKRRQALENTVTGPRIERICAGKEFELSRKRCVLEPVFGSKGWFCHKKEVLRRHPEITIYHDVINDITMEQIREYAHTTLTNKAWVSSGNFITPQMGTELEYSQLPRQRTIRYSAQKLSQAFSKIPGPKKHVLQGWGPMHVLNTGRTGINMARYNRELHLKPTKLDHAIGVMFAFLSEPIRGGDVVMKNWRLISPAPKGSILIYYTTDTKLHSLCPTLGGSQWVAVQPFYEGDPKICLKKRRRW